MRCYSASRMLTTKRRMAKRAKRQRGWLLSPLLIGVVCAVVAIAPVRGMAGDDGMTVVGEVRVIPVGDILRRPASFFDLEGKTVTFTPDGAGRYSVQTGDLTWVETSPATGRALDLRKQTEISLPFAFPFAGRIWTSIHANTNGNVSFAAPETTHWEHRSPFSRGTMRSVAAAVDVRSAGGMEAMIAVLWAIYEETEETVVSVDSSPARVAITWNALRMIPRNHYYEPLGRNVFQVRLYPSGVVELAYQEVSERDGIVGLFQGTGARGKVLSAASDDLGDVPNATLDIVSAELVDNGSMVIGSVTMADEIPESVPSGTLAFYFTLNSDGGSCRVGLRVRATGRKAWTSCNSTLEGDVPYTVQGSTVEVPISKLLHLERAVSWRVTAVWWGGQEGFDRLYGQSLNIVGANPDLSLLTATVTGNIFEVFHYPAVSKDSRQVISSIYGRAPADEELAAVFTDFRFDDIYNTGPATGAINAPVLGIGGRRDNPRRGSDYASDTLLSALSGARYIGGPRWVESGTDDAREFHGHSYGVRHVVHELVHRWAAFLQFKDPASGRLEDLMDESCGCHWSKWLHVPVRYPVWRGYSNQPYSGGSVMSGGVWQDNGDGTFTEQDTGYPRVMGLSDLDLYVMGMIPPEEVRPTFLLRDVVETGKRGVVRATKVLVRIEDIVAAMGPRVPSASEQRKRFKLGVYLLHEDGRAPRADLLARAQNLTGDVVKYFTLATTGSADAHRQPVAVRWY